MPFFRAYAFHRDDAFLEKHCRPADFFACDTLIQEEIDGPGLPRADEPCERPDAAARSQ